MKTIKWICRYLFFAVLLALAVLWCLKCQETIDQLEELRESPAYIDMVIERFDEAVAVQQKIKTFRGHQTKGIIAGAVTGVALLALVAWHIFGGKISKKVKARLGKRTPKVKAPRPVPQWGGVSAPGYPPAPWGAAPYGPGDVPPVAPAAQQVGTPPVLQSPPALETAPEASDPQLRVRMPAVPAAPEPVANIPDGFAPAQALVPPYTPEADLKTGETECRAVFAAPAPIEIAQARPEAAVAEVPEPTPAETPEPPAEAASQEPVARAFFTAPVTAWGSPGEAPEAPVETAPEEQTLKIFGKLSASAPAEPEPQGKYCNACGRYYQRVPVFCPNCGNRMLK